MNSSVIERELLWIIKDTHFTFIALELFQEVGTKVKHCNRRCPYSSYQLGNYKGFRGYVPGTLEEDQNKYTKCWPMECSKNCWTRPPGLSSKIPPSWGFISFLPAECKEDKTLEDLRPTSWKKPGSLNHRTEQTKPSCPLPNNQYETSLDCDTSKKWNFTVLSHWDWGGFGISLPHLPSKIILKLPPRKFTKQPPYLICLPPYWLILCKSRINPEKAKKQFDYYVSVSRP